MIEFVVKLPVRLIIRGVFFVSLGWVLCFNTYHVEADASAAVWTLVISLALNIAVFFYDHIDLLSELSE